MFFCVQSNEYVTWRPSNVAHRTGWGSSTPLRLNSTLQDNITNPRKVIGMERFLHTFDKEGLAELPPITYSRTFSSNAAVHRRTETAVGQNYDSVRE
jgi:hypothetical protein